MYLQQIVYTQLADTLYRRHSTFLTSDVLFRLDESFLWRFILNLHHFSLLFVAAYYGQGTYFAANASYSAQTKYAVPNKKEGHQSMFICQVIIGKYTVGKKGMKVATQKDTNEAYDTLVEKEDNPTIFVAMSDAQAYPEYLVTFKVEKGKT